MRTFIDELQDFINTSLTVELQRHFSRRLKSAGKVVLALSLFARGVCSKSWHWRSQGVWTCLFMGVLDCLLPVPVFPPCIFLDLAQEEVRIWVAKWHAHAGVIAALPLGWSGWRILGKGKADEWHIVWHAHVNTRQPGIESAEGDEDRRWRRYKRLRISTRSFFSNALVSSIYSLAAYEDMILLSPLFVQDPVVYVEAFTEVIDDALEVCSSVIANMFKSVQLDVGIGAVIAVNGDVHLLRSVPYLLSSRSVYLQLRAELICRHEGVTATAHAARHYNDEALLKIRDKLAKILVCSI